MFDVDKMLREAEERDRARGINFSGSSAYGGPVPIGARERNARQVQSSPRELTPTPLTPTKTGETWRDKLNNSKILNTAQNYLDYSNPFANMATVSSYAGNQVAANEAEQKSAENIVMNAQNMARLGDDKLFNSNEYQQALNTAATRSFVPNPLTLLSKVMPKSAETTEDYLINKQRVAGEKALEGKTGLSRDLTEAALAGTNMLSSAGVSAMTGIPFLGVMAAQSGAQTGQAALDRGESASTAAALAVGSGAITAGIESFGGIAGSWGNKAARGLAKTAIGQRVLSSIPKATADKIAALAATKLGGILGDAASEGAEEFAEYYAQAFFNNLIADEKTPSDVREALQNAKIGGLVGGVFGGARAFAPRQSAQPVQSIESPPAQAAAQPLALPPATDFYASPNGQIKTDLRETIRAPRYTGAERSAEAFQPLALPAPKDFYAAPNGIVKTNLKPTLRPPSFGSEYFAESPLMRNQSQGMEPTYSPVNAVQMLPRSEPIQPEPLRGARYRAVNSIFQNREAAPVYSPVQSRQVLTPNPLRPTAPVQAARPAIEPIPLTNARTPLTAKNSGGGLDANPLNTRNAVSAAASAFPRQQQTSRVRSNTIENSPMFNDADRALLDQGEFQYDVITEKQSMTEAKQRLQVDFEGEVADLPKKAVFDGTDLDTAMGILEQYKNEARGKPADSPEAQRLIEWTKIVQRKGTEAGQRIQAFAKYSRTPEGAAVKSQKAVNDAWEAYKKKNPKAAEQLEGFANTLDKISQEYNAEVESNPSAAEAKLREALQKAMDLHKQDASPEFRDRILAAIESNRKGKDPYLDILKEFEGIPTLTDEDIINIMDIFEQAEGLPPFSRQRAEIESRAYKIVADKFDSSFMDKLTAWRYMSMLANPTTHIRNTMGNFVFGGVTRIKNDVGALIESAVKPKLRTKSLLTLQDKALVDAAKADYENYYSLVSGGGKYNPSSQIRDQKTVFKTKAIEAIRKKNFELLEAEDNFALKARYAENLSRFLKANGLSADVLNVQDLDARTREVVDTARIYAAEQAQKATFRDQSQVANALSNFSRSGTWQNLLVEGIIPFKKTPINILKRGIEYSPIGLAKGVGDAFSAVKTGKVTAAQAIDEISAGLTGSAILLLGAYLASIGVIRASDDEDKNQRTLDQLAGQQSYSLNLGNKSYTLDWLSPAAMPMLAGVEMYNSISSGGEDADAIGRVVDALTKIGEPALEMTLLSGLNSTIRQAAYSQTNPIAGIASNAVANYAGQMVPTALGKAASAVDPLRRSAFVPSGSPLPEFQRALQNAQRKIPFASQGLQPYVDRWGRTQENAGGSFAGRLAVNALSPGYYSEISQTSADNALQEVYLATGSTDIIPKAAPKSLNYKGEKIILTGDQHTDFQVTRGQTYFEMLTEFVGNPKYSRLPDEEKAAVMKAMNEFSYERAKSDLIPNYEPDPAYQKAIDAFNAGISTTDYYLYKRFTSAATADKDANGKTITDSRKNKIINYLDRQNLTESQRNYLLGLEYKLSQAEINRKNFKPIPLR